MKRINLRENLIMLLCISVLFLSLPVLVLAQNSDMNDNLIVFGDVSGLPNADLEVVVAKLINTALTFAGLFLVFIFLYSGAIWMLALGDETKVQKAKDSMIQGVIGLVIIMTSYSIANYLFEILNTATGS